MGKFLKYFIGVLLLIIIIIGVWLWPLLASARRAYLLAGDAKINLEQSLSLLKQNSPEPALAYAERAGAEFKSAGADLKLLQNNFLIKRQLFGASELRSAVILVDTGQKISAALSDAATLSLNFNKALSAAATLTLNDSTGRQVAFTSILEAVNKVDTLKSEFADIKSSLNNLTLDGYLKSYEADINLLKTKLDDGEQLLTYATTLKSILPLLIGYPAPSDYLLVLQNSGELRPTGGFIGTVGVARVNMAWPEKISVHDAYHLDMPASQNKKFKTEAPAPIKKYLGTENWYLRDANWSPDFPSAAAKMLWLYNAEAVYNSDPEIKNPPKFTGVVAITPRFVTDFLYLVGPVKVNGVEYSKDNFATLLEAEVEVNYKDKGISQWDRKKVIGAIIEEIKTRLAALPIETYPEILKTLALEVERKNFQIYLVDAGAENTIKALGWGGEIKNVGDDYLAVVDANLAAFKTDLVMVKKYNYQLKETANSLEATLDLSYQHTGGFDWKTTRYRSYTRIYLPAGAELISATGFTADFTTTTETYNGQIKKVVAGFFTIEPGHSANLEIKYRLPETVYQQLRQGHYALTWQKQAGNNIAAFNFKADFYQAAKTYSGLLKPELKTDQLSGQFQVEADNNLEINF